MALHLDVDQSYGLEQRKSGCIQLPLRPRSAGYSHPSSPTVTWSLDKQPARTTYIASTIAIGKPNTAPPTRAKNREHLSRGLRARHEASPLFLCPLMYATLHSVLVFFHAKLKLPAQCVLFYAPHPPHPPHPLIQTRISKYN